MCLIHLLLCELSRQGQSLRWVILQKEAATMIVELQYSVSFGKLDGTSGLEWSVELTKEEETAYEEAIKLRKPFSDYTVLEAPLERAYDELCIEEFERFKDDGEEVWGDRYTECLGKEPVDVDEITELVHNKDPHTLDFFHLTELSDEELSRWDAGSLDALPNVCDFDENFEPKNPFEWYWNIDVNYSEDPEDDELEISEATETLKYLFSKADGDYSEIINYIDRCYYQFQGEDLEELATEIATQMGADDYLMILSLDSVPPEKLNYDMCLSAVKSLSENIRKVPEALITKELCEVALKKDKDSWRYFPEQFIEYEMVYPSVVEDSGFFEYVPERLKTKELCLAVFCESENRWKNAKENIKRVPESIKDEDFYSTVIINHPIIFEDIPQKDLTPKLCMDYVKKGHLKGIPSKFLSRDLCLLAVEKGCKLGEVPESFLDEEMYIAAIRKNRNLLQYLPKETITEKMCYEYIRTARFLMSWYEYIPEELITQKMALEMIKRDPVSILNIPEKYRNEECCLISIEKNAHNIENIPDRLKTREFYMKAKEANPEVKIPEWYQD